MLFLSIAIFLPCGIITGCGSAKGRTTLNQASSFWQTVGDSLIPGLQNAETDRERAASQADKEPDGEKKMQVVINGTSFTAQLDSGKAASELCNMLPLTITMQELNGNEKHGDLPDTLTQETYAPGQIHAGDILLWGADTLVIFYKDFPTQYSDTKIGKILEPEGLRDVLGAGDAEVRFQRSTGNN